MPEPFPVPDVLTELIDAGIAKSFSQIHREADGATIAEIRTETTDLTD
jgi:hypothetical protein